MACCDDVSTFAGKAEEKRKIVAQIASEIHQAEYKIPGYRKIYRQMQRRKIKYSAETVRLACRRKGIISCVIKRKKRPKTTDSNHHHRVAKNVLSHNFKAERPNEKWLTDITYIETKNGFVYLLALIDLFSRCVIGWCVESLMR
ncbi:MAG: DDE-type integrase/transposase/recombinase, partial [Fibrobacter sp.]|nr:DDE-type integrase/transposase/recombinase [Fibrobacter sp.]